MTAISLLLLAATTVYVSPNGSDRSPGTSDRPVATLERAVQLSQPGGTVVVKQGEYRITRPITVGRDKNGLHIKAHGGAVLRGGVNVPRSLWRRADSEVRRRLPSAAKDKAYQVDLDAVGVSKVDALLPRGFNHAGKMAPVELFIGDEAQTLARWPNTGYVRTGRVKDGGAVPREGDSSGRMPTFAADRRVSRWDLDEVWVYGYFRWDWADESIPVESYEGGSLTLKAPHHYGVIEDRPYYFENVLEELDSPGEYYIDRGRNVLVFWPSGDGPARLSLTDQPMLRVIDATGVTIEGLRFETTRAVPVEIAGGSGVDVRDCVFRNIGLHGVKIGSGTRHRVEACRFEDLGEGAVQLYGGDRATLAPAGHTVQDCVFARFMRRSRTYRPAVLVNGVGMVVRANSFTDAPHSAIIFSGNDHIIEDNYFANLLTETGDGGAVYGGRDWSARGTVIRRNLFHKMRGVKLYENGVYLDDQLSGTTVTMNAFVDCRLGLMVGGGRDNTVSENFFYDCDKAMHLDARGLGWASDGFAGLKSSLEKVPYRSAAWTRKYPGIERILEDEPMAPKGNTVSGNVLLNSGKDTDSLEAPFRTKSLIGENTSASGSWDVRVKGRTLIIGPSALARLPEPMRALARTYGP